MEIPKNNPQTAQLSGISLPHRSRLASVPSTCCNKGMRTMSCVVQMPQGWWREGKPSDFLPSQPPVIPRRAKALLSPILLNLMGWQWQWQLKGKKHIIDLQWFSNDLLKKNCFFSSYKPKDAFLVLLLGILPFFPLIKKVEITWNYMKKHCYICGKPKSKMKKKRRTTGDPNAAAYNSQPLLGAGRMMPWDRQPWHTSPER